MHRDTDDQVPPSKKPLLGSHRVQESVSSKQNAKMAISSLVHGPFQETDVPIKPKSKILATSLKTHEMQNVPAHEGTLRDFSTPRKSPLWTQIPASTITNNSPARKHKTAVATEPKPKTPSNMPKKSTTREPKTPEQPRFTSRVQKPSRHSKNSKIVGVSKSKFSKRLSAKLEKQLQDSAASSWSLLSSPSPHKLDASTKKVSASKARSKPDASDKGVLAGHRAVDSKKKGTKKAQAPSRLKPVRRSERIQKRKSAGTNA